MTTPAFTRDVVVLPVLRELRACAAEQFGLAGRIPCRFPITWGQSEPPADACDCTCNLGGQGQAWVRWVSTAPAQLGASTAGDCTDGTYEITVELGVYRCWPLPENGPLDEGEEELAAEGLLLDAAAIRRAFLCCAPLDEHDWELTQQQPMQRQGGCTGVTAQAKIIASDCQCGDFELLPRSLRDQAEQLHTGGSA